MVRKWCTLQATFLHPILRQLSNKPSTVNLLVAIPEMDIPRTEPSRVCKRHLKMHTSKTKGPLMEIHSKCRMQEGPFLNINSLWVLPSTLIRCTKAQAFRLVLTKLRKDLLGCPWLNLLSWQCRVSSQLRLGCTTHRRWWEDRWCLTQTLLLGRSKWWHLRWNLEFTRRLIKLSFSLLSFKTWFPRQT